MLLWWIKWAVEGSFTANLLFIDTNKWLWVTPVWQHYENWSVLMAQISWFFFAAMIVIAWRCRRKMYRLFYVTHHVGIVFLLFGLVHAWSFWYFVAPGLCLWWVDRMNRLVGSARALQVLRSKAQSHSDGSQVTVSCCCYCWLLLLRQTRCLAPCLRRCATKKPSVCVFCLA